MATQTLSRTSVTHEAMLLCLQRLCLQLPTTLQKSLQLCGLTRDSATPALLQAPAARDVNLQGSTVEASSIVALCCSAHEQQCAYTRDKQVLHGSKTERYKRSHQVCCDRG